MISPAIWPVAMIVFFTVWAPAFSEPQDNPSPGPLSLRDCYRLALEQSETIAINQDVILEAESRFLQSLGTVLPHVSINSTDGRQDKSGLLSSGTRTFERSVFVSQNLFSGFKEFAAVSATKSERKQREHEKRRAEQLLWVDVADAFYLLLEEREDLGELEQTKNAYQERIKELEDRQTIGRSRLGEVVSTRAQFYAVEAEIQSVKAQEKVARDLLEFLTGTAIEHIQDEDDLPAVKNEEYYLSQAENRPDVLALSQAWEVAKRQILIARSGLFPSVKLEGNYYLERNTTPQNSLWDALLTVEVPIFQGTETWGLVTQTRLQAHESELRFQRSRRDTLRDIRDSYAQTAFALTGTQALKLAVESTEENYRLQQEDYRSHLVNNLDVLTAIQLRQDARRNHVRSFYETKRLYQRLLVSSGTIELEMAP